MTEGDDSFCVQVLHTICGGTMERNLTLRAFPFHRICAKITHAPGHTISRRAVLGLREVSLSSSPTLTLSESVFIFDCYTHKVTFISVTCLGGRGISDKQVACYHRGANRCLALRVRPYVTTVLRQCKQICPRDPCLFPILASRRPSRTCQRCQAKLGCRGQGLGQLNGLLNRPLPLSSCAPHRD